jgi:class 3 adenylate cyclase
MAKIPPSNSRPTFLFTDIVDSSKMTTAFGSPAYIEMLLGPHKMLLRAAFERHHGFIDSTAGDSFFVAFDRAEHALECARQIQVSLANHPITATDPSSVNWTIALRIGIHTAEKEISNTPEFGYSGQPDANCAHRVLSQAVGAQILVSHKTRLCAANAAALKWHTWPYCVLRGIEPDTQTLYELLWDSSETRGEPKERRLPDTFRIQKNRYIARPELKQGVIELLNKPPGSSEAPAIITLRGSGGMGKTRLAVECALLAAHTYPGGIFFVPLDGPRQLTTHSRWYR